jgi:hypothetical protein
MSTGDMAPTGEIGRSKQRPPADRRPTKPWHQRPWRGVGGRGIAEGEVAVRGTPVSNRTSDEDLALFRESMKATPAFPGAGVVLVEGPGWATAESREAAVREACAALGVVYEEVPIDKRAHAVGLADDPVVVDFGDDEPNARRVDEYPRRRRANGDLLGEITHYPGTSTTNGRLGKGLVLVFDAGGGGGRPV